MELRKKHTEDIKDFSERVRRVYVLLDWKWANSGYPSAEEIELELLRFISQVYSGEHEEITSVGLYAKRDYYDEENWGVEYGMAIMDILPPKDEA